jgi:hypothetical protein
MSASGTLTLKIPEPGSLSHPVNDESQPDRPVTNHPLSITKRIIVDLGGTRSIDDPQSTEGRASSAFSKSTANVTGLPFTRQDLWRDELWGMQPPIRPGSLDFSTWVLAYQTCYRSRWLAEADESMENSDVSAWWGFWVSDGFTDEGTIFC